MGYSVCVHIVQEHHAVSSTGTKRYAGPKLCEGCVEIVEKLWNFGSHYATSAQKSYRAHAAFVQRLQFRFWRPIPNVYIFTFLLVLWVGEDVTEPKPKGGKGLPPGLQ